MCPKGLSISRLIDSDVSEHERVQLRRHMNGCPACRTFFYELKSVHELVACWEPLAVGPRIWAGVSRGIMHHPTGLWSSFYQLARKTVPVMVSLLMVVVFFLTLGLMSGASVVSQECQKDHLIIENEKITEADVLLFVSQNTGARD